MEATEAVPVVLAVLQSMANAVVKDGLVHNAARADRANLPINGIVSVSDRYCMGCTFAIWCR